MWYYKKYWGISSNHEEILYKSIFYQTEKSKEICEFLDMHDLPKPSQDEVFYTTVTSIWGRSSS